jgi:hypothetical protein
VRGNEITAVRILSLKMMRMTSAFFPGSPGDGGDGDR